MIPLDSDLPLFAAALVRERRAATSRKEEVEISTPSATTTAEIVAFPITRFRPKIEVLARRLAKYDGNRARFFLRRELVKSAERRIKAGIPAAIALSGIEQLERAVLVRIASLWREGGHAA